MLLARAHKMDTLGTDADPMMHKMTEAAKARRHARRNLQAVQ